MILCNKCGAHLEDNMKYCDKCGSEVSAMQSEGSSVIGLDDIKPLVEEPTTNTKGFKIQLDKYISMLPHPLAQPGDRTSLMIGFGSVFALALVYIICFFAFMSDICMPVAIGLVGEYAGVLGSLVDGASPLWIIAYFVLNLFPLFFAVYSFFNKNFRLYTIYAGAFSFIITLFTLISWAICEPSSIIESIGTYSGAGMVAWYALLDSLSEAWYLKILLSLGTMFGFGVDYIINKGK